MNYGTTDEIKSLECYEYATKIASGEILSCRYVQQAVERFFKDLDRSKREDFPYHLSPKHAKRIVALTRMLPFVEGTRAGKPGKEGKLDPNLWHCFILQNLIGWVRKDNPRVRKYELAYIEVAKKNSKTTMIGVPLAIYGLGPDHEHGAQVNLLARTKEQAGILFQFARKMLLKSPEVCDQFGFRIMRDEIFCDRLDGVMKCVSTVGDSTEGKGVHFGLCDEFHTYFDRQSYNSMVSGNMARQSPLVVAITTAGKSKINNIAYETRQHMLKVLRGAIEDEQAFAMIYTLDRKESKTDEIKEDRWDDPETFIKANPDLGRGKNAERMKTAAARAKASPAQQIDFMTKQLNIWAGTATQWLNMHLWLQAPELPPIESHKEKKAMIGLDLSSKLAMTNWTSVFEDTGVGELREQSVPNQNLAQQKAEEFQNEFQDRKSGSDVLIVEVKGQWHYWIVSGYDIKGEFQSIQLTPEMELYRELNRVTYNPEMRLELALGVIGKAMQSSYCVYPNYFLPQGILENDQVSREIRELYRSWAEDGLLTLLPGVSVNYNYVRSTIRKFAAEHEIEVIAADPYNALQLLAQLEHEDQYPVSEIKQTPMSLSEPAKNLEAAVLEGRIRHGNHQILAWNAENAQVTVDYNNNIFPKTTGEGLKIDGISSIINVMRYCLVRSVEKVHETTGQSRYEEIGVRHG